MEQEAHAVMSHAFLPTTQIKGPSCDASRPSEPNLVLYCPYADGQVIADAMLERLAIRHEADVVVVDPLALCSGRWGIFGPDVEDMLQELYKSSKAEKCSDACGRCPYCFFDQIVNLPSPPNQGEAAKLSSRRIIYVREVNRIADFFLPLLEPLLQAVHRRRNPSGIAADQLTPDDINPTLLVFSMLEDGLACRKLEDLARPGHQLAPVFRARRKASSQVSFKLPIHVASYFFPIVTSDHSWDRLNYSTPEPDPNAAVTAGHLSINIIPEGHKSSSLRSVLSMAASKRDQQVWNTWLAITLNKRHAALLHPDLSKSIRRPISNLQDGATPENKKHPDFFTTLRKFSEKTSVLLLRLLDNILRSAIGLASSSITSPSEVVRVTNDHLFRALDFLVLNHSLRSDWATWSKKKKDRANREKKSDKSGESDDEDVYDSSSEAPDESDEDGGGSSEESEESEEESEADNEEDQTKENSNDSIVQKLKDSGKLDKHEQRLLSCVVDRSQLDTTFEDVCIPPFVMETLRGIVSAPLRYPEAFRTGILKKEAIGGILLYGPPGTGKTMVCRALAKECGSRMMAIKPSSINDMRVGESEKLVTAMFKLAKKIAPCIIFIDEIDALFRARSSKDPSWRRDILNEIMQSMDGITTSKENKEAGIVVVGATNRPYDLDDAILRRLPSRMLINAPNEEQRGAILRSHLRGENLDSAISVEAIAKRTQYYSGSDLKNLCVSAAMASVKEMVTELENAQQQAMNDDGSRTTIDKKKKSKKLKGVATPQWTQRTIKLSHIEQALKEVPPSSSDASDLRLYSWHATFGRNEI